MGIAGAPWFLPVAGLVGGIVMGFAARRYHFCTMGALERHWYAADSEGLRTWVLAAASALIATQTMMLTGMIDIQASFYLTPVLGLGGTIIGGVAFGFGMALVGTCGFGALVRTGGGSLRALVVLLVLGLSALAAQRGMSGHMRIALEDVTTINFAPATDQSFGGMLSFWSGVDLHLPVALAAALALLYWIFRDAAYRKSYGRIGAGIVIGLVVAFGWLVTSLAAQNAFRPVQIESASFVAPVGETIMAMTVVTGIWPDYGVGLVLGVVIGAAACAFWRDDMRWEACDDARELGRHLVGGVLMGTGGIFALGCTIGQGVSAVSVLAISAPIAVASMMFGARMGLSYLIEGSPFSVFRNHGHDPAE